MRVIKKTNLRIEIDYLRWTAEDWYERKLQEKAEELRDQLGSFARVEVVFDELPVCSHCGYEWDLPELGRPWCCDAAIKEWRAEHPELAAQLVGGGEL